MKTSFLRHSASLLVFASAFTAASAFAKADVVDDGAATDAIASEEGPIQTAQEIVVLGQIGYRNRSDDAEPVLVYDQEFFQRFEPLTAGDALKRVPSVTFLSDVIESDGARLRGLAPGYTQILINGEKVPGSNADRSFFMDRIPAELISRVEIVRSSSARRSGDAMAGTLNIVLRDGYQLDGGYVRAGGLHFDDGKIKPSFGAVYGGEVGPGRLLLGVNVQGRYNPKLKQSLRYGESPENDPDYATNEFDNREDQTDTRDGTDYSANATYKIEGDDTDFEISGFYVRTDRTETERSFEYDDPTAVSGPLPTGNLLTDNANVSDIDQENYSLAAKFSHEWSLGKTSAKFGYAKFKEDRDETENEIDFDVDYDDGDVPELESALTTTRILDKELSFKLEHEFALSDSINLIIGGFAQNKDRDSDIRDVDDDAEFPGLNTTWDQFSDNPDDIALALDPPESVDGGFSKIEEDRRDAFIAFEGKNDGLSWEAGVRYETTDYTITDLKEDDSFQNDYELWLPSASVKFDVTGKDRLTASVARTNRRPEFNFLSPATLQEEFGDDDLLGNPFLKPETAWGVDLGYERRLGASGVAGINFFYRDVKDLIELTNTGVVSDNGDGIVVQPQNIGDGKVYGIEFDLSTDLGFLGLPDTGIFGNVSWLDSEISDELGERRFNGQSEYVYNFGFIQDVKSVGAAFGATYRKQGKAFDRLIAEEVTTTYGADLEIFVEKRFGDSFTIRAVGSNLLNGKKREVFNKFDNLDDQLDRNFDEYELEAEEAGPVFQIIARYAF